MTKQTNIHKQIAISLICQQCNKNFILASYDQPYYDSIPNICPICRRKIAAEKMRQQEELDFTPCIISKPLPIIYRISLSLHGIILSKDTI